MTQGHWLLSQSADSVLIDRQLKKISSLEASGEDISINSLSQAYTDLAKLFKNNHQFREAKTYLIKAIELLSGLENREELAENHVLLANIFMEEDERTEAILELSNALEIYKDFSDSMNYLLVLKDIGINYDYLDDHETARIYYEDCIALARELNRPDIEGSCLKNIGGMYSQDGDQVTAIEYFEKAITSAQLSNDSSLLHRLHHGLGLAYTRAGDFSDALPHCRKALEFGFLMNDQKAIGFGYQVFGIHYLDKGEFDSAEYYMDKTLELAKKISNAQLIDNAQGVLEQVYYKTGRYKQAYDTYHEMSTKSDSVFSLENTELIAAMKEKYKNEKEERELAEKNLQLQEASYSLKEQRNFQIVLIVVVILLTVIVFLIYRSSVLRKKANHLLRIKNEEIEQHIQKVENLSDHKNRWFINVAHELRTPLTLIKGPISRILKNDALDKEIKSDLILVDRNTSSLTNLVNEILELSRIEEGEVTLKETTFDLNELLARTVNTFDSKAIQQGITLRFQDLHKVFLTADREKLHKVFFNLLSNALKFTPEGGSVEVILSQKSSGEVCVVVKDNGSGIQSEDLPFIFDRFYQTSQPSKDVQGGTGIGLALSKEITEMHGGSLRVSSTPGMGSTFKLNLPAELVSHKNDEEFEEVLGNAKTKDVKYAISSDGRLTLDRRPQLLLVEDNDDMRAYVGSLLKDHFEIVEAINGRVALGTLEEKEIEFIISDVMMPEMDGVSFLKQVKASPKWKYLPFVHLSALSDETLRKEVLRIGIDDFLVKPFDPEELIIRVKNLYANFLNRSNLEPDEEVAISYDEKIMRRLKEEVIVNLDDNSFNVLRLADAAAMSERQLYRYLKTATGLTPLQFIQEIKLSRAHEFARKKVFGSTSELASAVGFKQAAYFSTLFEKRYGKKPGVILKS